MKTSIPNEGDRRAAMARMVERIEITSRAEARVRRAWRRSVECLFVAATIGFMVFLLVGLFPGGMEDPGRSINFLDLPTWMPIAYHRIHDRISPVACLTTSTAMLAATGAIVIAIRNYIPSDDTDPGRAADDYFWRATFDSLATLIPLLSTVVALFMWVGPLDGQNGSYAVACSIIAMITIVLGQAIHRDHTNISRSKRFNLARRGLRIMQIKRLQFTTFGPVDTSASKFRLWYRALVRMLLAAGVFCVLPALFWLLLATMQGHLHNPWIHGFTLTIWLAIALVAYMALTVLRVLDAVGEYVYPRRPKKPRGKSPLRTAFRAAEHGWLSAFVTTGVAAAAVSVYVFGDWESGLLATIVFAGTMICVWYGYLMVAMIKRVQSRWDRLSKLLRWLWDPIGELALMRIEECSKKLAEEFEMTISKEIQEFQR